MENYEQEQFIRFCPQCNRNFYLKDCTVRIPRIRDRAVWICPQGHEHPSIAR